MSTSAETISPQMPQVYLTESAATKLHALFLEEGKENLKLRISIDGGGCSGFKYQFDFETIINEDDYVFKKAIDLADGHHEIAVVVDSMSFLYLQNAEVDYEKSFQDERFIIRNPNAQTTCGCGSSFSV